MFMVSFRLSRKRLVAGAAVLVLVVGFGLVMGVNALRGNDRMASAATPMNESAAEKPSKQKKVPVKTDDDRIAFIQSFGWEVDPEPVEVLEVIIPEEFDQVYQEYNDIQKKQGYDLERYAGKRCKRYAYRITNHPNTDCEVRISLLVYSDKLIGGDVCSTDADGFMHGFAAE